MRLIPFTRLRYFGVGDEVSCLSRGSQLVGALARDTGGDVPLAIESLSVLAHCERLRSDAAAVLRAGSEEGRLSLGASWSALYHNPVDPEDLVRNLVLGQRWLLEHVGSISEEAYLGRPCSGGAQLPQILEQVGVKRVGLAGLDDLPDRFRWRAPGGASVEAWHTPESSQVLEALSDEPGRAKRAVTEAASLLAEHAAVGVGEDGWIPPSGLLDRLVAAGFPESVGLDTLEATCSDPAEDLEATWQASAVSPEALHPWALVGTARVSRALVRAEATLALGASLGRPADETEGLWQRLLEVCDGTFDGTADRVKAEAVRDATRTLLSSARSIQHGAETWVAERVVFREGPAGTLGLVVFNPNPFTMTGPVTADVVFYGETRVGDFERYELYRIVDESGTPVEVEETHGKQVETAEIGFRFIARDVPACGYKTYYLIPKPARPEALMPIQAPGAMAPEFTEPTFAIEDVEERVSESRRGIRLGRRFRVADFDLNVDEVSGTVQIVDRGSERVLVRRMALEFVEDTLASRDGEFESSGRTFALAPEKIDFAESGSVSATLAIEGRLLQSRVHWRMRLYADRPWVDVEVDVDWQDDVPGLVQMVFERPHDDHGNVRCATPFGSEEVRVSGPRHVYGWVAVPDPAWGLASDRRSFRFGEGEIRTDLYLSTIDPASYSYHRVWRRPPEPITARFRIGRLDGDALVEGAGRLSAAFLHPLSLRTVYDSVSEKSFEPAGSACQVEGENVQVTSIRPVLGGLEVRAFESIGQKGEATITVPGQASTCEVSLLGDPIAEIDDAQLTFAPHEIKTIRILNRSDSKE